MACSSKTKEQPERDYEDQWILWEAEKCRLLNTQKELETKLSGDKNRIQQLEKDVADQKRAWEADKDRLLKMQKELDAKLSVGTNNVQLERDYEDQKELCTEPSEDKYKIDQLEKDVASQERVMEADKDPRLELEKDFEANLRLENRKKSLNPKEKLQEKLEENEQRMMVLAQEKRKLLAELRYISDPVLIQTIRPNSETKEKSCFKAAEENKYIVGMTILDKELYVARTESSNVDVYDTKDFSFSRRLNLKELMYPMDIVSCDRNKCLYIFNYKGYLQRNEILRVDPLGNLINSWSTLCEWGRGLSVTDESNVILAVFEESTLFGYMLNEYSPDGRLIRKIYLFIDLGSGDLPHAIKLTSGHFLICQTRPGSVDGQCRVFIVDEEGKLTKSFEEKRESKIEQITHPVHLSVDANGFVLVADQANSRILLLDSDLQFKGEILSKDKHGLRYPCKIVLDESNGRLLVADNETDNQQILIFRYD